MQVWYAEIDPDGDTLIILPHPPNAGSLDEGNDAPAAFDAPAAYYAPAEEEPLAENEPPAEDIPPAEENPAPDDVPCLVKDEHPLPIEATEEYSNCETHFKVSMKHLTLASRRARAMFTGNYIESQQQADGLRHWKFEPLFDPAAFKIVMDAIHGHTQKLPKTVSMEMIGAEREGLLEVLTTQLHSLIQNISDNVTCEIECRSNIVGTLVHEMMSSNIFLPRPCRPFEGLSLSTITGMIWNFQLPGLYYISSSRDSIPSGSWIVYREKPAHSTAKSPAKKKKKVDSLYYGAIRHKCDLQDLVDSEITNLQTEVEGLKLSMFV
ncbi:hypothetical protein QQX98_005650 [Neonectria punicea]|uniref:BTB domain-containing protein n=1 Tax=Neonectria punicea TaxID=979145 RepID=A0ABR1H3U8_9HYPO